MNKLYLGLLTKLPAKHSSSVECTGKGYSRIPLDVGFNLTFSTEKNTMVFSNNDTISFPEAKNDWYVPIVGIGIYTAKSGGRLVRYVNLEIRPKLRRKDCAMLVANNLEFTI